MVCGCPGWGAVMHGCLWVGELCMITAEAWGNPGYRWAEAATVRGLCAVAPCGSLAGEPADLGWRTCGSWLAKWAPVVPQVAGRIRCSLHRPAAPRSEPGVKPAVIMHGCPLSVAIVHGCPAGASVMRDCR